MRIDPNSEIWRHVEAAVGAKIDAARRQVEVHGLSESDTEYWRGQLAALRSVLLLAETDKAAPVVPHVPY